MKRIKLAHVKTVALAAAGVFLGRGAQADTVLTFDSFPPGQANNQSVIQVFGDNAAASSDGVSVGTPNIGLTWQASAQASANRWDFYNDSVWSAGQLNSSNVGDYHEVVFTPNNPGVSVVVKSFNFHPYYNCSPSGNAPCERYTYTWEVRSGSNVFTNGNLSFLADASKDHPINIGYKGGAGQALVLRLNRVASTLVAGEIEGGTQNIAVDDIAFAQVPEMELPDLTGPMVISVFPNPGPGAAPEYDYRATITNGVSQVVSNSIQLKINGNLVGPAPSISQADELTMVRYQVPGLLTSGATNKYTLTFNDNSVPAKSFTNELIFSAAVYVDKQLPSPIVFEDFNSTDEGNLPSGWSSVSFNDVSISDPSINFVNLDSAAYTNWTAVDAARFTSTFETYSQGAGTPAGEASDYQRVLAVNPVNVVNGEFVKNLATGRFAFADSGYRNDPLGQILYLFTPDFDLTGKANVYLSFHSLWEQNQDSIAAVEYSVDQGVNWLPIIYLLDGPDVLTNLDGSIDALGTFTTEYPTGGQAVAAYVDPVTAETRGGFYGAFIGVASNLWSTLGPNISRRADDDPIGSKRVEIFRLPKADNQPKVRFRFAHAGRDSWYFGIDDFGLYSIPLPHLKSIISIGSEVVISWDGAAGTRLQMTTSLATPLWQDVPGTDGANVTTVPIIGNAFYRVARPY